MLPLLALAVIYSCNCFVAGNQTNVTAYKTPTLDTDYRVTTISVTATKTATIAAAMATATATTNDPMSTLCRDVGYGLTVVGGACGLFQVSGPMEALCGVGLTIFGEMTNSGLGFRSVCFFTGHYIAEHLPSISLLDRDGNLVETHGGVLKPHSSALHGTEQIMPPTHELRDSYTVILPNLGAINMSSDLFLQIGIAAGNAVGCSVPGMQRCINGSQTFITCGSGTACNVGGKWQVVQKCPNESQCRAHPHTAEKIVCVV